MLDLLTSWQAGALAMSFAMAAYLLVNQHLRLPPRLLMIWRGFGQAALFLPFALYFGPPDSPMFYLFVVLAGAVISILDRGVFQAALDFGAGTVSRLMVLAMPLTFVLWVLLNPLHLAHIMAGPLALLVPIAMGGVVLSILFMRRDPVSRSALMQMVPLIVVGSLTDIFGKLAFGYSSGPAAYTTYAVISGFTAGAINLLWSDHHHHRQLVGALLAPRMLKGGLMVVAVIAVFLMTKTPSIAAAPNPGLVTAIGLLAPVWVVLWNRWHKVADTSNLWAGLGCVASALLLILATV